jgi:hypothetical protein
MINYRSIRFSDAEIQEFKNQLRRDRESWKPREVFTWRDRARLLREEGNWDGAQRVELDHDDIEVGR